METVTNREIETPKSHLQELFEDPEVLGWEREDIEGDLKLAKETANNLFNSANGDNSDEAKIASTVAAEAHNYSRRGELNESEKYAVDLMGQAPDAVLKGLTVDDLQEKRKAHTPKKTKRLRTDKEGENLANIGVFKGKVENFITADENIVYSKNALLDDLTEVAEKHTRRTDTKEKAKVILENILDDVRCGFAFEQYLSYAKIPHERITMIDDEPLYSVTVDEMTGETRHVIPQPTLVQTEHGPQDVHYEIDEKTKQEITRVFVPADNASFEQNSFCVKSDRLGAGGKYLAGNLHIRK